MKSVTTQQMKLIEHEACELFGIPEIIMMENAGRSAAGYIYALLKRKAWKKAFIVCGNGHNGGDGLVAARHLHNKNIDMSVLLAKKKKDFDGLSRDYLRIIENMNVSVKEIEGALVFNDAQSYIVDALLGTGVRGMVSERYQGFIQSMNHAGLPIVSIDIPSGIDSDTGMPLGAAVHAEVTVVMAALKSGMVQETAKPYVGNIVIADIGIPKELIDKYSR